MRFKRPSLIQQLQQTIHASILEKPKARRLLKQAVDEKSWEQANFGSFVEWAMAPLKKGGLGVHDQESAEAIRDLLLDNGDVAVWAEMLQVIARGPGYPGQTSDPNKFYRVTTATTGNDRMLRLLMRNHPKVYERLCQGEFGSIRKAANDAGISKSQVTPLCSTSTMRLFRKLTEQAKLALVVDLVSDLELSSQLKLIDILRAKEKHSS